MAEENNKLHFNTDTGKWENLPEGYKIQGNKNYKIGDKTVAVLYTYQPYWSEFDTILLIADENGAHYSVTPIPRNFDFSRIDSLDWDYRGAIANQQVRYELSLTYPELVPTYENSLFGHGLQPVFDNLQQAKEYATRTSNAMYAGPKELMNKSFPFNHNPKYVYSRQNYIVLSDIPDFDKHTYRVPLLLTQEADMFAVVDTLKDKGYDIKGDGIKKVWYIDFETEDKAKDFARVLHTAMVDNDSLSKPYADMMEILKNPIYSVNKKLYDRIDSMEEYAKMMTRYGEGAFDIDLEGKGVSTLDRITGNLPSTEIKTLRYDNGRMTFFGQDGNSYRIEHLSGDSIKSLIKVENEVLESEERSRSPKENPYYFCIANLTENYLKEEFDKTLSFNTPRYLELAREEDWNYTLTTDLIYKSPLRQKGDEVIAKDSEYTVVFNRDNGDSYHIYRNITEEDVRKLITLPSSGLNLGDNPTEDVKNLARRIESEQSAGLANTQENTESSKKDITMEENKNKTYYLSVAYLQESDAKEYLDKYRESDSKALLYEAANWDQGDDIVQSNVYSKQGVHPGDMTLVQDENYALIYNPTVGGDYEVLRKITEQDIRKNIDSYGIEEDATDTVKKIAYAMVKEEFQSIKKEPAFEMPSGDILHFQYNEETNKVEVGTITNAGLAPLHEFDYDHDYTLDENIGDIYSKLSDMEEYQPKETLQPERVSFDNKEDLKAYIREYCDKHGWDSDLNHIDVSRITDMSDLFYATTFTGDISKWDVSNVTNMSAMFQACHFNGDISQWDVSNVRNMNYMFLSSYFNGDISKWDTSNVRGMEGLFAESFFNGDISNWNTENVKTMKNMFSNSEFNGDISQWDVSNVRNMNYMFANTKFGGDISNWDVSNVRNMSCMFFGAEFDGNISNWNTANVKNMSAMFQESKYSGDISKWDISNVRDMSYMFCNSKIKNIPDLSLRPDIKTKNMLINTPFEGREKELKVSTPERVSFDNKEDLKAYINDYCEKHGWDSDLNHIDVSRITDMSDLFNDTEFTGDISKWDVSNVTNMYGMFDSSKFNGDISKWNTSKVTDMSFMFDHSSFNHPIENWNTENVNNMMWMFASSPFNQPLDNWNTSRVKNMEGMFAYSSFNQPLDNWDVSEVKYMVRMFENCPFSHNLSSWDIGKLWDASYMFKNSGIKEIPEGWDLSEAENTKYIFGNDRPEKTQPYTLPEQDVDMVHEESPEDAKDAYAKLKEKNPEAVVICKGGDNKYRIFKDDADYASRELGIPLEKRMSDGISMITFTQRELDINLPKLIRLGKRAAIIDGTPDFIAGNIETKEEKTERVKPVDKWKQLKEQNPDKVILLHEDGRYLSYDNDAKEICKALKVYTLRDNDTDLPLAYWEDKGEYADRYDKVVDAIDNLSVWDITNPDTKEAVQRAIVRETKESQTDKTWQDIRNDNPGKIVLTLKDNRYHAYQEDAKLVSKILGMELVRRDDFVMTTSFPATALDVYGRRLTASGYLYALTDIDYSAPVEKKETVKAKEDTKQEVDPIDRWKELKAQNSDKITLMQYKTGYLVVGKDADAIPENLGIIHEKFNTPLGTGLVVSSLYRDMVKLQEQIGPLAVWDDVNTKDIKVRHFPEEKQEVRQAQEQGEQQPEETQNEARSMSTVRKQWTDFKKDNPDSVVLLKSGDFYQTYDEDAQKISGILGITLTKDTKQDCYVAGFPVPTLDEFMDKLNKAKCTIVLKDFENVKMPEQKEEPKIEQKPQEKEAVQSPDQTDNSAKVAALKGEAYQAYLLDKALGNAAQKGGVFVNERKMAEAKLYPHNDVSIPAFNNVIMTLHTERMGYATNTYTTFRGAKSQGLAVKRDEKCLGVNNFGVCFYINTFDSSDVIPKTNYQHLPADKQQQYRPANKMSGFRDKVLLYNIDQTNTSSRAKELYKKMVADTHREKKNSQKNSMDNVKKFDELVKKNPNSMPLFKTGHFYESYKEGALVLNHLLDCPIVEDKKKGCKVASFPVSKIEQYLPKIAKQYHVSLIESSDIINGKTTIDYRKEASDFIKKVAKEMGVKIDKTTYMLTSYDKKDDTISLHVNNLDPGKPNSTDIKDINAMYRAISQAAEIPDRLDRSGRIVLNYGDCEKYDALVTELAAASLMIKQGLPARISEENMELIPYWQRELKENPNMVSILELNTNATIKAIMRHYEGKDVDYSKLRGTSQRTFLPPIEYSIVRNLASFPNVENKSVVIIRDPESKEAAVILPAGASTKVNNEIPGMNKHRYELALRKEGYEKTSFYNADGYLSLNQPNSYFKDKEVTVEQLHQYDLVEVLKLDLTEELARFEKPEIERIRGLKNDEGRYELYIKPVGKPEFTVRAQYADVTAFYKSLDNPNKREGEEQRKAIGQKYYELVKTNPEHLTNLLKPAIEGINIDRLQSVNVTKDPETKKPLFSVRIDGQKFEKTVPNEIWQRFWTTSDPAAYKRAYAAVLFAKELGRKETVEDAIAREDTGREEKKPEPVEVQDTDLDGQDTAPETGIAQDDKKEIRRGGRGR